MTATVAGSSWVTWSPEDDYTDKFGASLVARAKKRVVMDGDAEDWFVLGDPTLGDAYANYHVTFDGARYHCDCRDHAGGRYRSVCSHALAVMLWRRGAKATQRALDLPAASGSPRARPVDGARGEHGNGARVPPPPVVASPPVLPTDAIWGADEQPWPEWVTAFRDHQMDAAADIVARFEAGDHQVFLDAPTGAGKTLIAEMVRRLLKVERAIYVCSTKSLQGQFVRDFPYAKVLMGRSNYATADRPDEFGGFSGLSAADCTKAKESLPACSSCPEDLVVDEAPHCMWCHPVSACGYERAKRAAAEARLACTNTAYLLTEANSAGVFSGADLVIVDEADLLESELMGLVEVRLSERTQKDLGIGPPEKKTVEAAWVAWLKDEAQPAVKARLRRLPTSSKDVKVIRERTRLERLADRMRMLARGLADGGWVYAPDERTGEIAFKPVRVDGLGAEYLWRHADRWLLMSATVIEPKEIAESLGVAT